MRYAMILNGRVENVILWDGEAEWRPGPEWFVLDCGPDVQVGWTYEDGVFARPS